MPAHDVLFWDQVIETDQSRFFVLRRILFGFSVISIHAKPFDSDLFSGAEFEKCSPICQQRTVKHENREKSKAFVNAARGWSKATKEKKTEREPPRPRSDEVFHCFMSNPHPRQPQLRLFNRSDRPRWTGFLGGDSAFVNAAESSGHQDRT